MLEPRGLAHVHTRLDVLKVLLVNLLLVALPLVVDNLVHSWDCSVHFNYYSNSKFKSIS